MLSNESVNRESITLVKGDKILQKNLDVAETFNAFFMNIPLDQEVLTDADHIDNPVLRIIERLKKHPSVVVISENHRESAISVRHKSLGEITKK